MNADDKRVTGYLLIKTNFTPSKKTVENDQTNPQPDELTNSPIEESAHGSKKDENKLTPIQLANKRYAEEIASYIVDKTEFRIEGRSAVRGAIVTSNESIFGIIISFSAKDKYIFYDVAEYINKLKRSYSPDINGVATPYIDEGINLDGFVGPP